MQDRAYKDQGVKERRQKKTKKTVAHRKDGGNGRAVDFLKKNKSGGRDGGSEKPETNRELENERQTGDRTREKGKKKSTRQEAAAVIIIQALSPSLPSENKKKRIDIDMSSKWSGD